MEAGFNKEAGLGEFFFEFGEAVYEHKLIKALEKAGATQVTIMTFANNDANESASNALLRVWTVAAKSGVGYIRGACQEALLAKTKAKQQSAKEQAATSFDEEKTAAAIKQSLAELGEVNKQSFNKIGVVDGKVDTVDGKMDKVQEGVCVIIPEYKAENEKQKQAIAELTKAKKQQEQKTGAATAKINIEIAKNMKLEADVLELKAEMKRKDKTIADLREAHSLADAARQMYELKAQITSHFLRVETLLEEDGERERKRARFANNEPEGA